MHFTPHLDENVSVFVQIYTFYPTFGRKSFDIIYYCPVNCFQDIDMVVFIIYPAPYGKESCQSDQFVCYTVNRIQFINQRIYCHIDCQVNLSHLILKFYRTVGIIIEAWSVL